ncbi:MAG: aminotransferase [Roseiflexaceae bacterium]
MKIREFGVEIWMNRYENDCTYNLAETCVASLTIDELLTLAGLSDADVMAALRPMRLTYGAIEGSKRLRTLIAQTYERQALTNIVVTHGAIGANALVHAALVEPGDRVISVLPTYQQHYSIPESYAADLQILPLREENLFLPDLDQLRSLARPGTKLIAINNPNNPTGALMDRAFLEEIVAIARASGAWLLSDEVYRGIGDEQNTVPPAVVDLYERGISTGSMSKAYSLAGLRLGWIAAPTEVLHAVSIHRDYTTISVGMLDDFFAAVALEHGEAILERSRRITRANRAILAEWVANEPLISWVPPRSGTTALLKYHVDLPSAEFCVRLQQQTGVMLLPGSVMDMEGYVRIGYANHPEILTAGLARMREFLAQFAVVTPTA